MIKYLTAGVCALVGAIVLLGSTAFAQTPPLQWDGVIVPTGTNTCQSDGPITFRATYRPYISDRLSGAGQPSQLVVYSNFQRNDFGFRLANTAAGQFDGTKSAARFAVTSELNDATSQSNTGGPMNVNMVLTQTPTIVGPAIKWIKITGSITRADNGQGAMACTSNFLGVFVQRPLPAQ